MGCGGGEGEQKTAGKQAPTPRSFLPASLPAARPLLPQSAAELHVDSAQLVVDLHGHIGAVLRAAALVRAVAHTRLVVGGVERRGGG